MTVQRRLASVGALCLFMLALAFLLEAKTAAQVDAQSGPAASELAMVLAFGGSDKLQVQNDAGLIYRVQYIGVRGPVRSSVLNGGAAAFHGPLVLGQRVLLESEGKDEDEGYKLRHVYLDGEPVPLGARVVAAGWATTIPYPLEHRHRALYLQLQQQAIGQQANLWQPGVLGPAAPWRPSGSAEPGFIAADPGLHRFLDLLYTIPTGQGILNRLLRTTPTMLLRDMPAGVGGFSAALGYQIQLNRTATAADPHVLAAVIAHEGTHTVDFAATAAELTSFSCFELEQRAFGNEAIAWTEFFGPAGKPDPQDDFERSENYVLSFARRGDVENLVRRSAAYEAQCAGERTPG